MKQNILKLSASLTISFLLFTTMFATVATAAGTPTISANAITVNQSDTATVVISLNQNPGIWCLGLKVGYDHNALKLNSYTAGNVFTEDEITPPTSLDRPTYFFLGARNVLSNTTATGTLVTLKFTITANAAYKDYAITLELDTGNTINIDGEQVSFQTNNGKVTVLAETTVPTTVPATVPTTEPTPSNVVPANAKTEDPKPKDSHTVTIIIIVIVLAGGATLFFLLRKRFKSIK